MLKQDTYLINIARAPFKLSNLKQPIYYKLQPEIITNDSSFIAHHDNPNYKLLQDYYKLQQKLLQITAVLLHITAAGCYKLWQLYYKLRQKIITNNDKKLLQITTALIFEKFKIITNYVKIYFILRQFLVLLQITANFITNYGRYYKLRRYYKLHCNSKNRVFYGLELNLENRVLHLKNNIQRFT